MQSVRVEIRWRLGGLEAQHQLEVPIEITQTTAARHCLSDALRGDRNPQYTPFVPG
jgi:hypothetical protein